MNLGFELLEEYTLYLKPLYKKLLLGQPNGSETFGPQVTEVKKLITFSFVFLLQF